LHTRVHSRGREGQGYSGGGKGGGAAEVVVVAAACAAAARAEVAAEAAHEAVCAQPRVRTLKTANHNGWQRGERLDGRGSTAASSWRSDKADEADDEAFCWGRQQR
jgi:hypothetical protein